ncbi:type II secretion system protein N [soil metagenome]
MIRAKRPRRFFSPALAVAGRGESTLAEKAWTQSRRASRPWVIAGILVGIIATVLLFAPAAWLAQQVATATHGRVVLADARGTVWSGSAVAVLTGGPGSRDASSLPGRIRWSVVPRGLGFELRATHACCLKGTVALLLKPGFGRFTAMLLPVAGWIGQWPSGFLSGLGTPWNTLQLGGSIRLVSPGITVESVQGRVIVDGRADIELVDVSSRLTTLDPLGSYRLTVSGTAANAGVSQLDLSTQEGALKLQGSGSFGPGGLRFRGEASAGPADEPALSNLLNIIGRRKGARSVISIG